MSESAGFVTIKDLTGATIATEDDDLIIQQGEETKRINIKTLGDLLVFLDKIEQVKTSTENGGINEIKATLSDGSTATFTTQNGHGIQKIEQTVKSDVSSGTNVITATLSDGQTCDFKVKNGDQGEKGDTGAALIDVVQKETSAVSGGKNVISFKLNDGSYKDVEVYNGAKGETGEVSQEVLNQTVNEAIAGVVANAPSDFDTLKEMSDWISEHEDDATAMNTAILENKNQINNKADKAQLNDKLDKKSPAVSIAINATNNTGVLDKNMWTKIATCNFFSKYDLAMLSLEVIQHGIRSNINSFWKGYVSLYTQSELTVSPVYSFICTERSGSFTEKSIKTLIHKLTDMNGNPNLQCDMYLEMPYEPYAQGHWSVLLNRKWDILQYQNYVSELPSADDVLIPTFVSRAIADESGNNIENTYATKNNIQNYSTTPQKIGTWIDGKDVYRVVIENELEGNILGQLAGSVESGAKIISAYGQITDTMEHTSFLPCYHPSYNIGLSFEGNSIYFNGWSNVSFTKVMMIVEYTK